jgi:hypothetical protein
MPPAMLASSSVSAQSAPPREAARMVKLATAVQAAGQGRHRRSIDSPLTDRGHPIFDGFEAMADHAIRGDVEVDGIGWRCMLRGCSEIADWLA